MHISDCREPSTTILTKCAKMTEEKHKRHGMNGNADSGPKPDDALKAQGGRLKFFKDGKFILELERAREGERMSWVSVPRSTFWLPQGTTASTAAYRQESSTSLSVSDDNSSVQSSPWQRDHSWKQLAPRRHQSKELELHFYRPKARRPGAKSRRRRRPHDPRPDAEEAGSDKVCNKKRRRRASLLSVVQTLLDKQANNSDSTPPPLNRASEQVVSPRKRFLREMDNKVREVEDGCQKRSRSKIPQINCNSSGGSNSVVTNICKVGSPVRVMNGCGGMAISDDKPKNSNSYSITSLLAEDRNVNKQRSSSSPSHSPSHYNSVATQPQYCSPSSEDRCVDRLRSMELSQPEKSGYSPYAHPSYLPPYMYQYPLSPYYPPGMYGRGYIMPSVYHAPPLPLAALRHDVPSCSWNMEPPRETDHREDNITDMPLNLSKHAG